MPLDKLPQEIRERKLAEAVMGFAERVSKFQPAFVSVVVKRIETHTRIALAVANVDVPIYVLPFPDHGHQNKYIAAAVRSACGAPVRSSLCPKPQRASCEI